MRKCLAMIVVLALVGCNSKPRYQDVIDRYLHEHLNDPGSYQLLEMGEPGIITPMSKAFEECNRRMRAGEFPVDSINAKLDGIKQRFTQQGINPYDTLGWSVDLKYRARNSFGALVLEEYTYTFNKDMSRIIKAESK